jgi:hypothetical protein
MTKKELIQKLIDDPAPDDVVIADGYMGQPMEGNLLHCPTDNTLMVY